MDNNPPQQGLFDRPAGILLAGVDEAGRGPLVGSVVAAAVILDPAVPIKGLADSKKLTAKAREALFSEVIENASCWSIAEATPAEIDQLNILQATMVAMKRAVDGLEQEPGFIQVDGNRLPDWQWPSEPVVKGDSTVPEISAASILAKVTRDRQMEELDQQFPGYGFAQHKGYPTSSHYDALRRLGVTPLHRRSFRPVREAMAGTL